MSTLISQDCPTCGQTCTIKACPGELKPSCLCACPSKEIRPAPSKNLLAGTIMAQRSTDGFWDAYDPNATNGLEYPRGVLKYHTVTDETGRVIRNTEPFGTGCGPLTTQIFICGIFRNEQTVGDLAAALAQPGFGRLLVGFVGSAGEWKLL